MKARTIEQRKDQEMKSKDTSAAVFMARRCRHECKGRCCRYITIQISAPRDKIDMEEIRWFLAHRDISVYVVSRRWNVEVRNRCKYLNSRNLCDIYEKRPEICSLYDFESCEYPKRPKHKLQFDTIEQFDAWRARKRRQQQLRRKRRAGKAKSAPAARAKR